MANIHEHGDNVILIGMPGAGKSTVGVLAAKALGFDFIDTDVIIQQAAGRLLPDIIEDEGIDGFLEIEGDIISSLEICEAVISTGGSAVLRPQALKRLCEGGLCMYLRVSLEEIERRITNIRDRGIAMNPDQDLRTVYEEREAYYTKAADIIIDCDGKGIEDVVNSVTSEWKKNTGDRT